MRKLFYLSMVMFTFSCKTNDQKLREQITPILTNAVSQDSLAYKIDSIKIYKIDTLTDLKFSQRSIINLTAKGNYYLAECQSLLKQADLKGENARLSTSQAKLYYGVLESKVLGESEVDDAKRYIKESQELLKESDLYKDSATISYKKANDIKLSIKNKKITDKNFHGYSVLFKVLGSDKMNREVKKDSLILYLSPVFRIIPINTI